MVLFHSIHKKQSNATDLQVCKALHLRFQQKPQPEKSTVFCGSHTRTYWIIDSLFIFRKEKQFVGYQATVYEIPNEESKKQNGAKLKTLRKLQAHKN